MSPSQLERGNDPGLLLASQLPLHQGGNRTGGGSAVLAETRITRWATGEAGPGVIRSLLGTVVGVEMLTAATDVPTAKAAWALRSGRKGFDRLDDPEPTACIGQPGHDLACLAAGTEPDIEDPGRALDAAAEDQSRSANGSDQAPRGHGAVFAQVPEARRSRCPRPERPSRTGTHRS